MLTYIIRRLLLMIPTLIGVTMVVFFIMAYAPGGFQSALAEGSQGAGVEARRLKQEMINRYALDKPTPVQYTRWLNQVSPVGFKMSGDIEWTKKQEKELLNEVKERAYVTTDREADTTRDLVLTIAAYADLTPDQVLAKFDAAAEEPLANYADDDARKTEPLGPAPELFELIDAEPLGGKEFWDRIAELHEDDPARAVNEMFRELRFSSINKSRVLFGSVKLASPDLGNDKNNRNVGDLILERLPITLLMNVITIPLIYVVSIISGVLAARWRGGFFDVVSGAVMLALYSVPVILAGTLLIAYLANSQYLRWFPASGMHDLQADAMPYLPHMQDGELYRGYLLDFAWHLILPVTCLTYTGFAFLTKVMRGSVLETISADFVRTARAKGVTEKHILFRHVLRNSLLPLITMAAAILPSLFVGSFVVEYIFSIQGMGLLTIEAAKNKDINIMMATTLVGAGLSLFSLLLRDILYAMADPRVTYD
jgi:ABC-type dipeptide/oligopeptide/nickel transport system permease component